MPFEELSVVRTTRALSGQDAYGGGAVAVPAGQIGTVVLTGDDTCDVEFFLPRANGSHREAILIVNTADLEPVQ